MNLTHLEYFITIAQTLSFSKSAEILHMTPSALTHAINKLEDELDAPLFEKNGRNISLTSYGETFYKYSKESLETLNCGINEIRKKRSKQAGSLSVVLVNNLRVKEFEPFFADFQKKYPYISMNFYQLSYLELIKAIKIHTHNFAICGIREDTIKKNILGYIPVCEYMCYAYVHKDHPLNQKSSLSKEDCEGINAIFLSEDSRSEGNRREPDLIYTEQNSCICSNLNFALNIVKQQQKVLLTFSPIQDYDMFDDIIAIPLQGSKINYGFIWNNNIELSSEEKVFIRFIRQFYKHSTRIS